MSPAPLTAAAFSLAAVAITGTAHAGLVFQDHAEDVNSFAFGSTSPTVTSSADKSFSQGGARVDFTGGVTYTTNASGTATGSPTWANGAVTGSYAAGDKIAFAFDFIVAFSSLWGSLDGWEFVVGFDPEGPAAFEYVSYPLNNSGTGRFVTSGVAELGPFTAASQGTNHSYYFGFRNLEWIGGGHPSFTESLTLTMNSGHMEFVPIPEPASFALASVGLMLVGRRRR